MDAPPRTSSRTAPPARPATKARVNAAQATLERRLGIKLGEASAFVSTLGLRVKYGAVVLSVRRGGAAHRRNFRRGDVIVALSTKRVKTLADTVRLGKALEPAVRFHIVLNRYGRLYSFYMRF